AALDDAARALVERGLAVWSQDGDDRPVLIVRGQARLLDSAREGEATRIFIGSENKLFALSGSSVIAKPVRALDGRVVGVVGVIGPTRLNYARVVPMVDFTASTLARLLA
ncbi:MAG: heat-inducible transcriptional repressor HrcA, partial [Sphingomonadales bacterium]